MTQANLDNIVKINKFLKDNPTAKIILTVDGSYNTKTQTSGYAFIIRTSPDSVTVSHGEPMAARSSQVGAELRAVTEGLNTIFKRIDLRSCSNYENIITIEYDYTGIIAWYTRIWKTKAEVSMEYVRRMDELVENIRGYYTIPHDVPILKFSKIAAHTGHVQNEAADRLAKSVQLHNKGKEISDHLYTKCIYDGPNEYIAIRDERHRTLRVLNRANLAAVDSSMDIYKFIWANYLTIEDNSDITLATKDPASN